MILAADTPWPGLIALAVVLVLGALATWGGFRALRRKRLIENVPTSKVQGVFGGLNEVKGVVRCDAPLVSFLAEIACVHYRYSVKEHWSKTETYRDSKGKTRTRTRSGWKTVDSGGDLTPFDLEDDTGRILVRPRGAEIQDETVFSETCGPGHPLYYGKGPSGGVSNTTHRRRFSESAISVDERIYVMGPARMRQSVAAPVIARDDEAELFLISTRSERQLTRRYGWASFGLLLAGTALAFAFPIALALLDTEDLEEAARQGWPYGFGAAGIYLGAVAVFYLVSVYNGLVAVRERAEMAWSLIDVQLKRRHDLVPRLVACVRGAAAHEAETQERLAALRTGGVLADAEGATEVAASQGQVLRKVFAVAESYPTLRTDENFAHLSRELVDIEDRIALARGYHNESVEALNTRIQSLPDVLLARLTGFRQRSYFAAQGFERAAPPVETA